MRTRAVIILIAAMLVTLLGLQQHCINQAKEDAQIERENAKALLIDVTRYRTQDSLNAATIGSLLLRISDFEEYRAEDAAIIKTLKQENRDLASMAKVSIKTTASIGSTIRDSIIYRDIEKYITDTIKCIDIDDDYFVLHGCIDGDKFDGIYTSYDSIIIAETIKRKRFLGFLWKTKAVKDRRIDVCSKNPNTYINDIEHIIIYK